MAAWLSQAMVQVPVVRKVDKVIHQIATFSNVLKLLIYWNDQMWCLAFQS